VGRRYARRRAGATDPETARKPDSLRRERAFLP
jgi:hypothetical protein